MLRYIWMLPATMQREIMCALLAAGIEGEDLELAMDGRVCDLEDTINIDPWR